MTDIAEHATETTEEGGEDTGGSGRRRFLAGGAIAAAAAVAGVALTADPAGAANGNSIIIGSAVNSGTNITTLTGSTFKAVNGSTTNTAIQGVHHLAQASIGVYGEAYQAGATYNLGGIGVKGVSGEGGTGVYGEGSGQSSLGSTGVYGHTGYGNGVYGEAVSGTAGNAGSLTGQGVRGHSDYGAALFLDETALAVVPSGGPWNQGAFVVKGGHLFYCYKSGSPGSWVKLSSVFVPLAAPKRVYDTRVGEPPAIGPKTPIVGARANIDLKGNASGVPAGASGALISVVATGSVNPGFAAFYKNGIFYPGTSNLNFGAGATVAVTTYTALDAASMMTIFSNQSCNFIVDVLGYYP